jgi:hypothetical protein
MASTDRFYQLEFRDRPVLRGDIGSLLKISGLLVTGGGAEAVLALPSYPNPGEHSFVFHKLTDEEWDDFIKRSDDPEILIGPAKIFQRKVRWEISGAVQQKVWAADSCRCMYCGRPMGEVQLTIDHFVPLEMGGENDTSNYLSACRKCNKDKGGEDPESFCNRLDALKKRTPGTHFWQLKKYLEDRKIG